MDISQCSFVKFSGAYLEGAEPAPSRHMVTYVWNILTRGILRRLKSSEIRFRPGLYSGATGWDHDAPSNSLVGWEGADPFLFHPHSSPIDVTFLMPKFKKKFWTERAMAPLLDASPSGETILLPMPHDLCPPSWNPEYTPGSAEVDFHLNC